MLLVPKGPARKTWRILVPLVLLAGMSGLLVDSAHRRSPTVDEPLHLVRGLSWWWTGDTRLSYAHPPLANLWGAVPAAIFLPKKDFQAWEGWSESNPRPIAQRLFAEMGEDARRALVWGRLMMALLALLTSVYAFFRVRQQYGWWTATVVVALFAVQATWLAHGRLLTTDFAAAALIFVLVAESAVFLRCRGPWPLLRVGLAAGLAASTKYTATLVPLVLVVVAGVYAAKGLGRYAGYRRSRALGCWGAEVLAAGLVTLLTVNASHGFQRTFYTVKETLHEPEPQNWITAPYRGQLLESTFIGRLPEGMRIPLPYGYVFGMASIKAHNTRGHGSLFFGKIRSEGHPAYFPLLLLIKTPMVIWIFLAVGVVAFLRAPRRPSELTIMAGLTALFLLYKLSGSRVNIGVRYALPVLPLLTLLAARGVVRAVEAIGPRWRRAAVGLAVVAFLAAPLGLARSYPDLLGYFNEVVGRERGHRISMVGEDWGQDAVDLGRYARRTGIPVLYYAPYTVLEGAGELDRLGVPNRRLNCEEAPPPGVHIAIHAALHLRRPFCHLWTRHARRVKVINDHVWVYYYPPRAHGG